MKKLKMILPMLAFILAIGMSFAFVGTTSGKDYYTEKFILVEAPNGWATIDVECSPENDKCIVKFSDDLFQTEYRVYDEKDLTKPSAGNGQTKVLHGSVPTPD